MRTLLISVGFLWLVACGTRDTVNVVGSPASVSRAESRLGSDELDSSKGRDFDWLVCSDGSVSFYFFRHDSGPSSTGRTFLSHLASNESALVQHPVVVEKSAQRTSLAFLGGKYANRQDFLLVTAQVEIGRGRAEEKLVTRFQTAQVPEEIADKSPMALVADHWLVWDDSRGATVRLALRPEEEVARWPADLGPFRNIRSFGGRVLWDTVRDGRVVTQLGQINQKGEISGVRNLPPALVEGTRPVGVQFLADGSVAWLDWNKDWANLRIWNGDRARSFRVLHEGDKPVLPFLAPVGQGKFAVTDGSQVRWLNVLDRTTEVSARKNLPQEVATAVADSPKLFEIFGDGYQLYLRVPSRYGGVRLSTIDESGFRYMTMWACPQHAFGRGAY